MEELGWVRLIHHGHCAQPVPSMPEAVEARLAERVRHELNMAAFKGEAVTKAILSFAIDSDEYVDNARPSFLVNPETKRPMELDRYYYREAKGWDYNGDQHYRPTAWYPESKHKEIRKRDLMKQGLSLEKENPFELIVVRRQELSLQGVISKIPPSMPRRLVDLKGPYARMLDEAAKYARESKEPDRGPN